VSFPLSRRRLVALAGLNGRAAVGVIPHLLAVWAAGALVWWFCHVSKVAKGFEVVDGTWGARKNLVEEVGCWWKQLGWRLKIYSQGWENKSPKK
jgi:hypothetical protein